ncbi:hypothetical protein BYT27DRAFT_6663395 [Phlegmacium glaucopus]|nr:hypothetical protein BYT27DRAFT_6663395 [Phlegmacium glaucopus]
MDWLIDYSNKHWDNKHWGDIEKYDDGAKVGAAMHLLRAHSGIKRLAYESALEYPQAPVGTVIITGPLQNMVPLISIFSNERSSFPRRPSQVKVDRLSEIMGKQPRWWIDFEDPQSYDY